MPEGLTQDQGGSGSGFFDSGFNRAALHVIAGAGASIGSRDGVQALQRGAKIGSHLQNSYLKEKQFEENKRRQAESDVMRRERHDLDIQLGEARLGQAAKSDFFSKLKATQALTQSRTSQYDRGFYNRVTKRQPTDGSLTYPIDEPMADRIKAHTRGSESRSNMDALFFSMDQAMNNPNPAAQKEAKFMSEIFLQKAGGTIIKGESGDFVRFDWSDKAYPVNHASAREIKKDLDIKLQSEEDKIVGLYQTRNTAISGSQIHILNRLDASGAGGSLNTTEKALYAEQYSKEIASNPLQSRTMELAHKMKRLITGADKKSAQFEMAELSATFEKAGIKWDQYMSNGKFVVNGKQMNDYFNKFNRGTRVNVAPDEDQVIVDEDLVKRMFETSGLNNLSDRYVDQAVSIAGKRDQAQAAQMEAKYGDQIRSGRISTQLAVEKQDALAGASDRRLMRDISKGKIAEHSYEKVKDNLVLDFGKGQQANFRDIPGLSETVDFMADRKFAAEMTKKSSFGELSKKYKDQFGFNLKHVLMGADTDGDVSEEQASSLLRNALSWMATQDASIKKQYDGNKLESMRKAEVRKVIRNPRGYIEAMRGRNAAVNQQQTQQNMNQQMDNKNKEAARKSKSVLDSLLPGGE
jgi:hypothetical protein